MEYPSSVYAMHPFDSVLADGKPVGLSTWIGYTANEGKFLSLAMMQPGFAEPGTEVTLLWGEPDGGTRKPTVEQHVQTEIKALVASVPYSEVARDSYAEGWRTRK
jgi:syringate O-demethylase